MAATVTFTGLGRTAGIATLSAIKVTVAGNGATYATASGGLPFDLAAVCKNAQANNDQDINPADVVDLVSLGNLSTNKFVPSGFAKGTPTYQAKTLFGTQTSPAVPALSTSATELATFPCTIRLMATGSGANAALGEFADGANSDTFTGYLLVNRDGNNA
jgi:hypothetical protein